MVPSVHISPDVFNANFSRSFEDSIILPMKVVISMTSRSYFLSILQNQNAAESIHEPCEETSDVADHRKVATHMTTIPGASSPVVLNIHK